MEEKEIIKKTHQMCEESLSPEKFEMWEQIKADLKLVRYDLNDEPQKCPECLEPCSTEELNMFGGTCESCPFD